MSLDLTVLASLACSGLQLVWPSRCFSDLMAKSKIGVNGLGAPALYPRLGDGPSLAVAVRTQSSPLCISAATSLTFLLLILVAFWLAASPGLFHLVSTLFLPSGGMWPQFVVVPRGVPGPDGRGLLDAWAVEPVGLCMRWWWLDLSNPHPRKKMLPCGDWAGSVGSRGDFKWSWGHVQHSTSHFCAGSEPCEVQCLLVVDS